MFTYVKKELYLRTLQLRFFALINAYIIRINDITVNNIYINGKLLYDFIKKFKK